jgi:hypothetical protein
MRNCEYSFRTIWIINATIEAVWEALVTSERWPEWWPNLERVVSVSKGDIDGIGSVRLFIWRGSLPYTLTFEMVVTRKEVPVLLEGVTRGDLEGTGRWTLTKMGNGSTHVQYDWNVRTNRLWMNIMAPLARRFFQWNHDRVMIAGGKGLEKHLRLIEIGNAHV